MVLNTLGYKLTEPKMKRKFKIELNFATFYSNYEIHV